MKAAMSVSISPVTILIAAGTLAQVLVTLVGRYPCIEKCMTIQFDNGTISQRALALRRLLPLRHR